MARLIIEGVTGAGKTATIAALRALRQVELYDEDQTFGDFMQEWLADPHATAVRKTSRLVQVLSQIESARPRDCLIERFHFSYYALDGDWSMYAVVDERAADLGVKLVLLDVADELLRTRSLYREEYGRTDWQHLIKLYGTESAAIEALRRSQQRRRDALAKSRMECIVIDTDSMDWTNYAARIWMWAG